MIEASAVLAPALPSQSYVLLIGYGNTLRGDDGVGRYVVETVPSDYMVAGARVLAVQQLTPELAEDLAAASCVVFVDASVEHAPGSVHISRVRPDAHTPGGLGHRYGPAQLLHLADQAYGGGPGQCWLVTVGGAEFDCAERLSPAVAAAVPRVHRVLRELLQRDFMA